MSVRGKKSIGEIEKLTQENTALKRKLKEAIKSIEAIKKEDIDALVIAGEERLKVYTEKNADKIYRILIEKMHEGAITLDKDGTILYANSYFANLVNQPLQKVIGTKFNTFIDDHSKGRFDTMFQQCSEHPIKEEIYLHSSADKTIPVLMSSNPLLLDNTFMLSIILTDLTVQNKNQEELKHRAKQLQQKNIELEIANKDLTSFTHVSSHDLQEPLRKIQNFVNFMLREESENLSYQGKTYLQKIHETAKRMQGLILDLLSYSRTKNDKHKFETVDLTTVLDEVQNYFEEELLEKKAVLESTKLCKVSIIRFQFYQLFYNLISNSLKFSNPQKTLHIIITSRVVRGRKLFNENPTLPAGRLSPKLDYCHLTYIDNGIGFEPEYNERIFEMFQRLHSQEEYPGTGIGLAICKRIVENHHGIITATGTLNEEATFDIYVPVKHL
ncbi:ATP-binding protein [Chryseolinea sp. H1M3-3]|uniref:sensor histidine kinase n=1 Tax=Chryseolinea sp. H1M3-3 TaxID=3034144 RepID=UPI0023ECA550|nr:ATP-binding protein [Chryseolinea sp. H1M3-3]